MQGLSNGMLRKQINDYMLLEEKIFPIESSVIMPIHTITASQHTLDEC